MVLTLPTTTRAAVYHAAGDIRIERVPLPAPAPGEVLARIRACGLCSSETMAWYMARKAPVALGHEPVGEVVAAGEGVTVSLGDRVFIHHHAPCHACRACRRGEFVHCETWRRTRLRPGGLSEFALVPPQVVSTDLLLLPAGLSDEGAVFTEPLATVVKAQRRARLRPDDRLAIVGVGVIGLLHLRLARTRGVQTIVAVDPIAERRAAATSSGADLAIEGIGADAAAAVREVTGGGADVVIVTPASLDAMQLGFESAAPGARLVLFTPLPPEIAWPLSVHDLFFREVTIIPSYSAGPDDTREALALLAQDFPVQDLITHRLPLDAAAEGYRLVAAGAALKVVVRP